VVGNGSHDDAVSEQQPSLEEQGGLIVEQLLPPVADHHLGDQNRDHVVLPPGVDLVEEPEDRPGQLPVGGVDDVEDLLGGGRRVGA
jgi:hypothetical protein